MSAQDVAKQFVATLKTGDWHKAGIDHWSPDVVSIEASDQFPPSVGIDAVKGKNDWWVANHEVHEATAEGPYVNGDQFAVFFTIDVTEKASGNRHKMDEVGLYTVKDGKIVEERFFYGN